MKYLQQIKRYALEITFSALIVLCFFIYFVVYMTPSRLAWYREMRNQYNTYYFELTHIGQ